MRGRVLIPVLALAWLAGAEIIDRIAVVVGASVITQSEIEREVRLTEFLNSAPLDLGLKARREAAGRLIEQKLIRRELETARYPAPQPADAEPMLAAVKGRFPGEGGYREAFARYGIGEDDLKAHLLWQLTVMRFIELRFRPGIQVEDDELEKELTRRAQRGSAAAPVRDELRAQVEQQMIDERVDRQLEQWLKSSRERTKVEYREEALR
jgi:hypothetical protein